MAPRAAQEAMPTRHLAALCALALLAGCFTATPEEADAASAGTDDIVAGGGDAMATTAAATAAAPSSAPFAESVIPILLDGSTGTQAFVCVDVAPPCAYRDVVAGESDLILEGLAGRIAAGALVLEWDAATPATEELVFGIMVMGGEGEACAAVSLGMARGSSPLRLEVAPLEREFCASDVLHVWASNGIYAGGPPAVAQLDVDQAFHLEGSVTLAPPQRISGDV